MLSTFTKVIFRLFGWKVKSDYPREIKKCIVISAPHTSGWDFVYGWLGLRSLGIRSRFLIKKEMFGFPLGPLIRAMGALPVDRGQRNNMVDYVASLFDEFDDLAFVITPEGTRKYNAKWKKGFYHIAMKAKVPILLGYLDYAKKEGGVGMVLTPSGDFDKDFVVIENFYRDKIAKHPENFNLTPKPGETSPH